MKNIVLVLTAFLLLFPYKLMAENKVISIVSEYTTYPILIDNWNEGEYAIQLKKGGSYMQGIIRIE